MSSSVGLPDVTGSVWPVLVTALGVNLWVAAWTDGREFYLMDADLAEVAAGLADGSWLGRRTAGGWLVGRAGERPVPLRRVLIGGEVHLAVGDTWAWSVAALRVGVGGGQASTFRRADREIVKLARACARGLLERALLERWRHTIGVADRAYEVSVTGQGRSGRCWLLRRGCMTSSTRRRSGSAGSIR